ncbi:MAG TPA: ABC transporter permease [Anaeromyxobacteraceae bacterium]|nr:ABC transporter permease [Anaeromyxobacteraceae bacterium]
MYAARPDVPSPPPDRRGAGGAFLASPAGRALARNWAACFLAAMLVVFSLTSRNFLSLANFQHVVHLQTLPLLLAAAETFVIISGGIDLSVGFVAGLASVTAATLMQWLAAAGVPVAWVIVLGAAGALLLSLLPGLVNGLVITRFDVPPFIATLGMWGIANGIALKLCQGFPVAGLPEELPRLGNGYVFYLLPGAWVSLLAKPASFPDARVRELWRLVPYSLPFVLAVLGALAFVLRRGRFGRHTYAVGGSMDAAVRAGIDVKRHLVAIYVLSSALAGLAGVFNVFQTGIGNYTTFSSMYELFAVAAVIIGGASLSGGKGRILGSAVGVLVLAFMENGLAISGVQPFYRYIVVGVLLIVAVVIDRLFPDLF